MRWLLVFICSFGAVFSQDLKTSDPKPQTLPDPRKLEPGWWNYFVGDTDAVRSHVEEEIAYLTEIDSQAGNRGEIASLIERVIKNFNLYLNLPVIHNIVLVDMKTKDKYTLYDLKKLSDALYLSEAHKRSQVMQSKVAKANLESDKKHLGTIYIKYREENENSPKRLENGLRIMNIRLSIEIEKQQLKIADLENKEHEKIAEFLEEEADYAREHLTITPENLNTINTRITQFESMHTSARRQVNSAQRDVSLEKRGSPRRKEALQQLIRAMLWEGEITLELINLQIEKTIVELSTDQYKGDLSTLHESIAKWKEEVHSTGRELEDWRRTTRAELERSLSTSKDNPLTRMAEDTLVSILETEKEIYYSRFLLDQLGKIMRSKFSSVGGKIKHGWHLFATSITRTDQWFNKKLFHIGEAPISLRNILHAIIVIAIAYLVALLFRLLIRRFVNSHPKASKAGFYSLSRLVFYFVFSIGIFVGISTLGVDFTAFAFVAGALTLGIGFGMQSIFNNFIAGLLLLLEKTVRVGDIIQLGSDECGVVKEIRVRTTLLQSFAGLDILIPNSDIISGKLTNWSLSSKMREIRVPFSVDRCPDKEKLKSEIITAIQELPTTMQTPPPDLWLTKIDEDKLEFELAVWVNDYSSDDITPMATPSRYLWVIESTLRGLR
jgi:potassium-dependent mechanosensitive channel